MEFTKEVRDVIIPIGNINKTQDTIDNLLKIAEKYPLTMKEQIILADVIGIMKAIKEAPKNGNATYRSGFVG